MNTFVETDCTIEHQGRKFHAGGAIVSADRIVCYAKKPTQAAGSWPATENGTINRKWTFTDWHGNRIGTGHVNSTWHVGPYRTRMYAFSIRLSDGRVFNGRGQGDGMVVTGKLAKVSA